MLILVGIFFLVIPTFSLALVLLTAYFKADTQTDGPKPGRPLP